MDVERIRAVAAELRAGDRLVADANTGWLMHDAMRVVRAMLTEHPELRDAKGAHSIPLVVHAQQGGEQAKAVLELLEAS